MTTTAHYGALSSITDPRLTYSMTDIHATPYTFPIFPLDISSSEINTYESKLSSNRWLICYKVTITPPTQDEIDTALLNGQTIKLEFDVRIYDNYGIGHILIFDTINEKYVFEENPNIMNIKLDSVLPFTDELINYIKNSSDFDTFIYMLSNGLRHLHKQLYEEITDLKNIIAVLDQRISALENS